MYLAEVEGEVVDEGHEEKAVKLHRHRPGEVLSPAEHDVLHQSRHHGRGACRVSRAARLLHQLLEVEVVLGRAKKNDMVEGKREVEYSSTRKHTTVKPQQFQAQRESWAKGGERVFTTQHLVIFFNAQYAWHLGVTIVRCTLSSTYECVNTFVLK